MEEKDFQRIEQLIGRAVKAEVISVKEDIKSLQVGFGGVTQDIQSLQAQFGGVREEIKDVRAEVGSIKEEITAVRADVRNFKEEIKNDFRLQVGILTEDFQHKLQLVAEGHQMLSGKMDRMQDEIAEIKDSVTGVAAELAAHRADTEGHKRGYMVSEP